MSLSSCHALFFSAQMFAFESQNKTVDSAEFGTKLGFHPRRLPLPVRYFAHMLSTYAKRPRHAAHDPSTQLCSIDRRIHILLKGDNDTGYGVTSPATEIYNRSFMMSTKNKATTIASTIAATLARKIKDLRISTGLKQADLAKICGVSQVSVSQWERKTDAAIPTAKALLKLSEIAPSEERQWWRDLAANQAGFGGMGEHGLETVALIPQTITIPLIKQASKVGNLGHIHSSDVEQHLSFPASWFPSGGVIRAARIEGAMISPLVDGDVIALIDISRRDPDRMVDQVVAVRTATGIEISRLRRDDSIYMLLPLRDGSNSAPRVLKMHGENSIVGQVVKWIGDASPHPKRK